MKKILAFLAIATLASAASAMTFWSNGTLMGTVCRNGIYYTIYPSYMAQPVGSNCLVRDGAGFVIGYGYVTNE